MKELGAIVVAVLLVLGIIFGFWMHYAAPCSWFSFTPAKDIPGRCLMVKS